MNVLRLILRNVRRNPLRSSLTVLAIVFLVMVLSMLVSVLSFLDQAMAEKKSDILLVITERYRLPSRFDYSLFKQITDSGGDLNTRLRKIEGFNPEDYNLWHFVMFSIDPSMKDKDQQFFVIAMLPDKIKQMVDSMEGLDPSAPEQLKGTSYAAVLMGPDRLRKLGKKVGDTFEAKSLSHRDGTPQRGPVTMTFQIVGELPEGSRWVQGAFMDHAYLDVLLKEAKCEMHGRINLGWIKVRDDEAAGQVSAAIEGYIPEVKCEKGSSAVGRFLEGYKDLLWIVKFLLQPAIFVVMGVIVANAISITVRERITELAVLKVLGFQPKEIFALVLGEASIIGLLGGLVGAGVPYILFNYVLGGIKIPFAFFPVFFVPMWVFLLGPVIGTITAVAGSLLPAWTARTVRVAEVFAKIA